MLTLTPQNRLIVKGYAAKVGIYTYPIGAVFVPPEELFSEKSMDTLKGVSVILQHHNEEMLPHNYADHEVGVVLDVQPEGDYLAVSILLHDGYNFDSILERGLTGLSPGSDITLVSEEGKYEGTEYNYKKSNIRYNHLAFCSPLDARGGLETKILDSKDNTTVSLQFQSIEHKGQEIMSVVTVDGSTFSVPDDIAIPLQQSINNLAESKKKLEVKIQDSLESTTTFEKELEETKKALEASKQEVIAVRKDLPELVSTSKYVLDSSPGINLKGAETSEDVKRRFLEENHPSHYTPAMGGEAVSSLFDFIRGNADAKTTTFVLDSATRTPVSDGTIDWEVLTKKMIDN